MSRIMINQDQDEQSTILDHKPIIISQPSKKNTKTNYILANFPSFQVRICLILTIIQFTYHLLEIAYLTQKSEYSTQLYHVKQSWFGLYRDDSDSQWRSFRESLPIYLSVATLFLTISKYLKSTKVNQQVNQALLKIFHIISGSALAIYMFRGGFLFWCLLTLLNYYFIKLLYKHRIFACLMWVVSIYTLYYLYYYPDQLFQYLIYIFPNLGDYIYQSHTQSIVRWSILYNMTLLRVLAYAFDKHWAFRKMYEFGFISHISKCIDCNEERYCYKNVSETQLKFEEYNSILNYYAYLLYLPLFISGPQITYNAYINQLSNNQNIYTKKQVLFYFIRALNNILIFEIFTHISFAYALSKLNTNRSQWANYTATQCQFLGMSNLLFIWLKFLTIWRLARAIALLDGINSPENMNRCVFNNYCFEGFWRSWHRGFNQWLIRYIFIPLGGNKYKTLNIWVVFTFVAIWHDFNQNLIFWAWFICLMLMPEMALKNYFNKKYFYDISYFKYLSTFVASIFVQTLIIANLVGFGNGLDNMMIILHKFNGFGGIWELTKILCAYYPLMIVQFDIRDKEILNDTYKGY